MKRGREAALLPNNPEPVQVDHQRSLTCNGSPLMLQQLGEPAVIGTGWRGGAGQPATVLFSPGDDAALVFTAMVALVSTDMLVQA